MPNLQVRWAVLNAVALLRQHTAAHDALAQAMQRGESVGACIESLERTLDVEELRSRGGAGAGGSDGNAD